MQQLIVEWALLGWIYPKKIVYLIIFFWQFYSKSFQNVCTNINGERRVATVSKWITSLSHDSPTSLVYLTRASLHNNIIVYFGVRYPRKDADDLLLLKIKFFFAPAKRKTMKTTVYYMILSVVFTRLRGKLRDVWLICLCVWNSRQHSNVPY